MDLLSLPECLLNGILGELSHEDLAAMALQSSRLRQLVNDFWERKWKQRWASTGIPSTWVHAYGGWAQTYRQLEALPKIVVRSVGRACQVPLHNWNVGNHPTKPRPLAAMSFDDILDGFGQAMEAVFVVSVEAATDVTVLGSYAAVVLRRNLGAWLATGPDAGFVYVQDLHNWRPQDDAEWEAHAEDIMDYVAWRRSALEFLPGLMAAGQDHLQLAPVLDAIAGEAEIFTYALEELKAPGEDGWPKPPEGVPGNHWWWWPGGPTPEGVVSQFAEAYAEEYSDSEGSD